MQILLVSPYRTKQKRTLRWRRASSQRYPGQIYDSESGLHQNGFRDYEAGGGRYIESDPIGLKGGVSTYGYVSGRPLNLSDVFGLSENCDREDECKRLLKQLLAMHVNLLAQFATYDRFKDGRGGWDTFGGLKTTKPGGHYDQITQLQNGLKNRMRHYKRYCIDKGGPGAPVPLNIAEDANKYVPTPVFPESSTGGVEADTTPARNMAYVVGAAIIFVGTWILLDN